MAEQKQMPNPTLVTINNKLLLTFTAYLKQAETSDKFTGLENLIGADDNPHSPSFYPTIFFYGLAEQ